MGGEPTQRRVLWATLVGIFVTSFPSVILVAALPDIAKDFGVGESSVGWVLTAPMIAASVLVPTFGRLGDLRGHRRVFLVGFALCAVLALLSAFSWDLGPLIVLRTLSQAAGVATTPTALALLLATHPLSERPKALGAWAFAGAAAPVIGLLAGGPLIGALSWRGLFVMQALVALAAVPLCLKALPETPKLPNVRFDVLGAITLAAGAGAVVFALDRSARWGGTSPLVLAAVAIAPVFLWAFVRIERRTPDPLLPLALARTRAFVAPVAADSLIQVPSIGAFFLAPLILHATFDKSVVETAYLLIPMPLGMSVLAPIGGWMTVRFGERFTSVLGCVLMIGALVVAAVANAAELLPLLLLSFLVHGAAMGMNRPSLASAAAGALDDSTTGVGMAVMRMISQLGSAAGISIAVAARAAGGFTTAYVALGVAGVLATACALTILEERKADAQLVALAGVLPALET
ncbi:MAG: Major Facilitator Superfamily transporter [Actinomycetia bacterium]|nr:Major Facilitator Superfamily transporter [Actinomycetes bacterium]